VWQANVAALRDLVGRVTPEGGEDEQDPGSRTAVVRAAIRNRLRRRGAGG
jgi:hypothetical protein